MRQEQISNLALLSIKSEVTVDFYNVIADFAKMKEKEKKKPW